LITKYECQCDCGKTHIAFRYQLLRGYTKSCGCLRRESIGVRSVTHGHKRGRKETPEHKSWSEMIARCENTDNSRYPRYGARGIKVCQRWRDSFQDFFADMGERPSAAHSIDRLNNDGHYEPDNCRWATASEQARNRRTTRFVEFNGRTMPLVEAAEVSGVKYERVRGRLHKGWTVERALTTLGDARRVR
jgi:hypothetical protein